MATVDLAGIDLQTARSTGDALVQVAAVDAQATPGITVPALVVVSGIDVQAPEVGSFANAGTGATVEPFTKVTVTGTGSGPGTWTQTFGPFANPVVSGATLTFTAPPTFAGASITFTYTVGLSFDTVTFTVLPVAEWAVQNGQLAPMQVLSVVRGALV